MEEPVVCVVDGDPAVRDSLQYLCDSSGFAAQGFSTQAAFLRMLDGCSVTYFKCVICEAQLPDGSGVELFQQLKKRGFELPFALMVSRYATSATLSATRVGIEHIWPKPLVEGDPLLAFLSR